MRSRVPEMAWAPTCCYARVPVAGWIEPGQLRSWEGGGGRSSLGLEAGVRVPAVRVRGAARTVAARTIQDTMAIKVCPPLPKR